jgi:hypothetical protein
VIRGADFSSYQDNAAVAHAIEQKIVFAFVKTTQGVGYVNPKRAAQLSLLRGRGVRVGVYHFLTADADGAAQWDQFEKTIPAGALCAVDHESDGGVTPPDHVVQAFIRRGHQRGFKVGRYGDGRVIRRHLGEDWTWVAWWSATPPPFHWDFWQFSNGAGKQDWNLYRGDVHALDALIVKTRPKPAPRPARWWFHDDRVKLARGPYRLPALAAALVAYLGRRPKTGRLRLERK